MTVRGWQLGVLLGGLATSACHPRQLTPHRHRLDAGCSADRDGAAIVCGDREFARIECHSERAGRTPKAGCRALAVRYADGETAWLHRAARFDPERPHEYRPPDKVDVDLAYHPIVALDGGSVWFYSRTVFSRGSFRMYDIQSGAMQDVERADEWRVWAALHEGRAVSIGDVSPPGWWMRP